MLKIFDDIKKNVTLKKKLAIVDNIAFRLHYQFTFAVLLVCTVLVSSQQYIGEHIRCIADKGVNEKVIETFCFFTSTFTVVRHLNDTAGGGMVPHPGVGPLDDDEPIIRHAYYQWVPFVLFGQALFFYAPHFIWKRLEGGRIKAMVTGFEHAALMIRDSPLKVDDKRTVPSKKDLEKKIGDVQHAFLDRLSMNRTWALGLVFCEILNLLNIVLQVWFVQLFLGGQFLDLGNFVFSSESDNELSPLDVVFPKVTKCTFHKYGPSGSIQQHDALCVMALNIVNEKIYMFLWFWFIFLFVITALSLVYRLLAFLLHSRSLKFNRWVSKYTCPSTLDRESMKTITQSCHFSDWLMLHYLALSMDGFVFRELYNGLAKAIEERQGSRSEEDHQEKKALTDDVDKKVLTDDTDDDDDVDDKEIEPLTNV